MSSYKELSSGGIFTYGSIEVVRDGERLRLANGLCSRTVDLTSGFPSTISLLHENGLEFALESDAPEFSFIGINMPDSPHDTEYSVKSIATTIRESSLYDAEHVRIRVTIVEAIQAVVFERVYIIYPDMPVIATENSITSGVSSNVYWSHRGRLSNTGDYQESAVDSFRLCDDVVPKKSVEFQGRTDYTNDLVVEHSAESAVLNGNLLFCEKGTGGFFILQEAPPSMERRDFESHDFRIDENKRLHSCCWGISPTELQEEIKLTSYRHVIGFHDKNESTGVLKNYLKKRFPQNPAKNYSVTVNTWGVGNFPKLLNEKFLIDEIKASAAVGATHYQIDDGWQAGGGLREISLNNRHVTPEFWKVSEKRLPEGFKNIDNEARKAGVELALWFAPSFNQEYRDWKEAADILTHFHRKHNIRMFKIDAVKIRTKTAEDNLRGMCEHLRDISKGEITFNFDTTNGQRPGYLMFLEYGNIFLENRYVHGAGIGYHPEDTLNNLWSLSRYLRTQTLQIEIPSHDDVNKEFYKSKDRLSPDLYPADYWAAIALFANPLLWLAPSKVSDALVCNYRKIIDLHLEHREAIFKGEISPVGLEPNGSEITGFISHNYTGASGYLLLFREIRATESAELSINRLKGMRFKTIHATCDCSISSDDKSHLIVRMMEPTSFALFQYESSETTV